MNNIEDDEEELQDIKIILVGETATGKTSLINTSIGLAFKEELESTHSSGIMQKTITINNKKYLLNLWDTIGQEQFHSLTNVFMKGAKIVIFVYDITRLDTFEQLEFWFKNTKEVLGDKPIIGIVGNKSDLYLREKVKEEDAEKYAEKKGVPFKLTSAKSPQTFCDFLEELVIKYIEKNVKTDKNGIKLNDQNKTSNSDYLNCCNF